jgi:hypothetical protein
MTSKAKSIAEFRSKSPILSAKPDVEPEDGLTEQEKVDQYAPLVKGPFVDNGNGTYDCVLAHPVYGDIPFTADPNDVEQHGRLIVSHVKTQNPKKRGG